MTINEDSLLAVTDPGILLLAVVVFCAAAFFCARAYRNTNDFAKSVRVYIPVVLLADIVFFLLQIPVILLLGLDLMGGITLALVSNYYFYR